jgi:hypothetical protein
MIEIFPALRNLHLVLLLPRAVVLWKPPFGPHREGCGSFRFDIKAICIH